MSGWAAALRLAVLGFGIGPEAFWRLSVREWRALSREHAAALGRAELMRLMAEHPDDAAKSPRPARSGDEE